MTDSSTTVDLNAASDSYKTAIADFDLMLAKSLISPDQIPDLLDHYLKRTPEKPEISVAFWGKPGVGKTSGIREYARRNNYRLVVLHLQLYDPSDLKGIPVRMEDGSVRWVTTSYLPQQMIVDAHISGKDTVMPVEFASPHAEHFEIEFDTDLQDKLDYQIFLPRRVIEFRLKPGHTEARGRIWIKEKAILFLDEISTANTDVQNAALSLVLDKRINEFTLNDSCRIVAAGNTDEDGAFVNQISSALANRFVHIVLQPTVLSFLKYAFEKKFQSSVIAFINMFGGEYLFSFDSNSMTGGRYGYASPRTWEMLSQQYDPAKPEWIRTATTVGLIGPTVGRQFLGFISMTDNLPLPSDILAGKPYEMPSQFTRGTGLLLMSMLVTRFREIFEVYKEKIHGVGEKEYPIRYQEHPEEWLIAQNGLFGFINRHLSPEARASAYFLLTKAAQVPSKILSGMEFSRFATENVGIISEVNKVRV
jgi:hypothetical protein